MSRDFFLPQIALEDNRYFATDFTDYIEAIKFWIFLCLYL